MRPREYKIYVSINGAEHDLEKEFGFHLLDSENETIFGGELREFETLKYPEKDGVKLYPRATKEAYNYKITFCAYGDENTVIPKVKSFESMLHDGDKYHEITVHNASKGISFNGYSRGIKPSEFQFAGKTDVIVFEWIILNHTGKTTL